MEAAAILDSLRQLTARTEVDFLPLAQESEALPAYAPAAQYLKDLRDGSKPESAAEGLFNKLCEDLLRLHPTRQVGIRDGWVDFMIKEPNARVLPLELKALFHRDGPEKVRRYDANPAHHKEQVKSYLSDHEYLVLTDLRTAWLCSARDYFFDEKPFATLPFADLLAHALECRSLNDAIRRAEDTADKPELERQFFDDLKHWFHEFDKVKWQPPERAAEFIILLLNKLIFAKTLEDFGLVPYRCIQDEYALRKDRWEAKGAAKVVRHFLSGFEDFFDEYYDTEIFAERIWDKLVADEHNYERFCKKLEFILGLDPWNTAMGRGVVNYNYRRIDEDIFGKSYEMFLAANRKDEGIYYTPAGITGPMADSMVDSLVGAVVGEICDAVDSQKCDFARAEELMAQLAEIRVGDTACGSGGFLIKVLRAFWRQYQQVDSASAWVKKILRPDNGEMYLAELPPNVEAALGFRRRHGFDNRRVLIARILLRHIYGVDKDAGALEVAKTNVWKEAVKLSAADYNYRDLKGEIVRILPNLELNFIAADSLVDVELEKQASWLAEYHQAELKKLSNLRARYIENPMDHTPLDEALELRRRLRQNLVEHFQRDELPAEPACFVLHFWSCWFTGDGKAKPMGSTGDPPVPPGDSPGGTRTGQVRTMGPKIKAEAPVIPVGGSPTGAGGSPAPPHSGFDGIIGNPPWEGFKPIRKEFAAGFYRGKPQFSKMGMDGPTFDKWFETELKDKAEFATRWREHEEYYERHKEFFGNRYKYQGTGDWNLFKLFIESDMNLVRRGGRLSLLVPSGFQTDEGCAGLRRWFSTEHRLDELTSFENRGYREIIEGREQTKHIFPDVDNRFKFGFFKVVKGVPTPAGHAFDARFYLHDPKDAFRPPIRFAVEMIHRFSPYNATFMEFRSPRDYELAAKIRGSRRLLEDFGYTFRRELHMTGDNRYFRKLGGRKSSKGELPLFEGKLIHQFDARFAPPSLAVEESEVREELLRKEIFRLAQFVRDKKFKKLDGKELPESRGELEQVLGEIFAKRAFKLQYEFERFAYREVANATNERTIIAAIVPQGVVMGHTLMYLNPYTYEVDGKRRLQQREHAEDETRCLLPLANSLTLNYYIRSKVTAHVSAFQFLELPAPELTSAARKQLAAAAKKLLANPRDVSERAALEVFIARDLYGLSRADWQHLTGSFTFGNGETKAELDEIIRRSLSLWPA